MLLIICVLFDKVDNLLFGKFFFILEKDVLVWLGIIFNFCFGLLCLLGLIIEFCLWGGIGGGSIVLVVVDVGIVILILVKVEELLVLVVDDVVGFKRLEVDEEEGGFGWVEVWMDILDKGLGWLGLVDEFMKLVWLVWLEFEVGDFELKFRFFLILLLDCDCEIKFWVIFICFYVGIFLFVLVFEVEGVGDIEVYDVVEEVGFKEGGIMEIGLVFFFKMLFLLLFFGFEKIG